MPDAELRVQVSPRDDTEGVQGDAGLAVEGESGQRRGAGDLCCMVQAHLRVLEPRPYAGGVRIRCRCALENRAVAA